MVEFLKENEFLYKKREPRFKDTYRQEEAWNHISGILGHLAADLQRCFPTMKTVFGRLTAEIGTKVRAGC